MNLKSQKASAPFQREQHIQSSKNTRDRPEAGPRDLQKAWQAQQKRTSEPPDPHPSFMLHTPFMERGDSSWLYTAIINTTLNLNQRSQPRTHADSQLQANLNPRNPTPKP